MIIAVLEKYEKFLIENLNVLINTFKIASPIELWQIGREISDGASLIIQDLKHDIRFKNVQDYTDTPLHWQGYQIKAFILKHTEFEEVLLCDCDTIFHMNPEVIFNDTSYKATGNFLFRDCLNHYPTNLEELKHRIDFVKKLIPIPNAYFPKEWEFVYTNVFYHTKHSWYYQESGVVYINKSLHGDVVNTIYELNSDWKETYKCVWGDKETFWLAFVIHNKPFYMNASAGYNHRVDTNKVNDNPKFTLTHNYKGAICFSQKGYPLIK